MTADTRKRVLQCLTELERGGSYSHLRIKEMLDKCADLPASQRAYMKRLAEGVTERRIELDAVIDRFSTGKKQTRRPQIRCILRMGIYEILYMDGVPDAAACSEAVRLAKESGAAGLSGYVNGLLRRVAREKQQGGFRDAEDLPLEVRYSTPAWIVDLFTRRFGTEETKALLGAMMEPRPVTIRMRSGLPEAEQAQLEERIREAGAQIRPAAIWPYSRYLQASGDLRRLPGYAEGLWTVQDESSMFVVEAAGLQGGETVCDVCAAPGGKAMHAAGILEASGKGGTVYACDLSEKRTERMLENIQRMHLANVQVRCRDASQPVPVSERGTADVLLCDVPCSGLGVMGRKRDIKYRVTPEEISALAALQKQILRESTALLKPGGTLIYSTCTISREENEETAAFIQEELGLRPDSLLPYMPDLPRVKDSVQGNMLQLLPHVHGTDGFFIARFIKTQE